MLSRLAEDHKKATADRKSLRRTASYVKKVETIETNIIIFYVNDTIEPIRFY